MIVCQNAASGERSVIYDCPHSELELISNASTTRAAVSRGECGSLSVVASVFEVGVDCGVDLCSL